MLKLFIILILLSLGLSSKIYLNNFNTSEFPKVSANLYNFDIVPLDFNSLFLFEQGMQVNIQEFDSINNSNHKSLNAYLAIDISNSMNKNSSEVNKIINLFINEMTSNDSLGIITYNQNSIIRSYKTNDTTELRKRTSSINYYGSNNLDELFFNSPFSIENISAENEDYILITDKEGFGDIEKIKNFVKEKKINLHIIHFSEVKSTNLENLSNGYYLQSIDFNDDIDLLSNYIFSKLTNSSYYKIAWKSVECSNIIAGNIVLAPSYNYDFSYSIANAKDNLLKFNPQVVKNVNINVGELLSYDIQVSAFKNEIKIDTIFSRNENIKVKYNFSKINSNSSEKFNISYLPTNIDFISTEIIIKSNCFEFSIPIEFGKYDISNRNLQLNIENGYSHFRGDTLKFKVIGNSISDTLLLSYKSEDTWFETNTIISNNKENIWLIPNLTPQTIDLKLSFKNPDYLKYNLQSVDLWGANPKLIKLSFDKTLCSFIGQDDRLYVFNLNNPNVGGSIGSSLRYVNDISISKNNENIAVANAKKIIIFDSDGADAPFELFENADTLSAVEFNNSNNILFAGTNKGDLNVFNSIIENAQPSSINKLFQSKISIINSNPIKNLIAFSSDNNDLQVSLYENNILSSVFNVTYESKINNIEWSNNGDSLFVSTKNKNFLYLVTFIHNKYELVSIYEKQLSKEIVKSSTGFESGLYFVNDENKIYIKNNTDLVLDSLEYLKNRKIYLTNSLLFYNSVDNKLNIYDLNKYKTNIYDNSVIFIDKLEIIPKFLNFKDIQINTICKNLSIDTVINAYVYNNLPNDFRVDSTILVNTSSNDTRVYIDDLIKSKSTSNLNITILPKEIGEFTNKIKVFSGFDSFDFDIKYEVIQDDIQKNQTYFQLPNVNLGDSIQTILPLFISTPENIKINKIVYDLDDEFISININDSILKNENISINFIPTRKGLFQETFRIYTQNACTPFDFTIYGKCVSPELDLLSIYKLDTIFCKDDSKRVIEIENIGDGNLNIINSSSLNNKLIFTIDNDVILPSNKLKINLDLSSINTGKFIDTLTFEIKGEIDNSNSFSIPINCDIFFSDLVYNTILDFGSTQLNTPKSSSFTISNNGIIPENISIQPINSQSYFDINLSNFSLDGKSKMDIIANFKGGNENRIYSEYFRILGKCINDSILFSIDLRDNVPVLAVEDEFNFNDVYCNSSQQDSVIELSNIGKKLLSISKIELIGDDKEYFQIQNWNENETIQQNERKPLKLSFKPTIFKHYRAKIVIYSNNNNAESKDTISISASYFNSSLSFSDDNLNYLNIESNKVFKDTITIYNNGNISENLNYFNKNDRISIKQISEANLNVNDSIYIELTFEGGLPDETITDSLLIESRCLIYTIPINIYIKGTNYFELSTANLSGQTGDIVEIPIYFDNPENITLATPFEVKVDIVVDKNIAKFNSDKSYIENELRILPVTFEVNSLQFANVVNVPVKLLLGNTDSTIISFRNAEIANNGKYYFESKTGIIKINNICKEGSLRFVEGANVFNLDIPYPNPTNDFITIGYSLIEDTHTKLYITNILGQEVISILDNPVSAQEKTISISVQNLKSGVYFINLFTNNNKITRKFQVVR